MNRAESLVAAIDLAQAARAGNAVQVEGDTAVLVNGRTGERLAEVPLSHLYASKSEVRAAVAAGKLDESTGTGDVGTNGVVYGSCGASWLYMRDLGSYDDVFEFHTGFDLNRYAYDFDWFVIFDGPGSVIASWADSGPMFPDDVWSSGWRSEYSGANGTHIGEVHSGVAYATNGTVCYSGLPTAAVYVS